MLRRAARIEGFLFQFFHVLSQFTTKTFTIKDDEGGGWSKMTRFQPDNLAFRAGALKSQNV